LTHHHPPPDSLGLLLCSFDESTVFNDHGLCAPAFFTLTRLRLISKLPRN
jgi:hypothetical protein